MQIIFLNKDSKIVNLNHSKSQTWIVIWSWNSVHWCLAIVITYWCCILRTRICILHSYVNNWFGSFSLRDTYLSPVGNHVTFETLLVWHRASGGQLAVGFGCIISREVIAEALVRDERSDDTPGQRVHELCFYLFVKIKLTFRVMFF